LIYQKLKKRGIDQLVEQRGNCRKHRGIILVEEEEDEGEVKAGSNSTT
jgi:hypothetical protein